MKLKIFTWNIASMPFPWYKFSFGNPDLRINEIIEFIRDKFSDYDIICIQEAFSNRIRNRLIEEFALYHEISPSKCFRIGLNGGLLTMSKYPFIYNEFFRFNNLSGEDKLGNKGYLYSTISKNNTSYNIVNLHLQANAQIKLWFNTDYRTIRKEQIKNIINKIKNSLDYTFVCGDFNMHNQIEVNDMIKILEKDFDFVHKNDKTPTTIWNMKMDYIIGVCNKKNNNNCLINNVISEKPERTDLSDHFPLSKIYEFV